MRAWTFVILRNAYLTDMRRNRFRGDYDETVAEKILTTPAGQEEPLHLSDMHRALMTLAPERREALLLVGAGGFSYEEAAKICDCAVGTIKSRVGRARAAITEMLEQVAKVRMISGIISTATNKASGSIGTPIASAIGPMETEFARFIAQFQSARAVEHCRKAGE